MWTAIYKGDEFPDYVGKEVLVDDDYSQPKFPCYKMKLDGEWVDNMSSEDFEFIETVKE